MRKELTYQTLKHNTKNTAQGTSVTNHQTEHIQNSPYSTTVKKIVQIPVKTVHEELPYQAIMQNTFKTVRKTLMEKKLFQNTFKRVRKALTYQRNIQSTFKTVRNTLT